MPFQSLSTAPSFPLAAVESQLPLMQRQHQQRHLWALAAPVLSIYKPQRHSETPGTPRRGGSQVARYLGRQRWRDHIYTSFKFHEFNNLNIFK